MKCPNDQNEMEQGSLNTQGARWQSDIIEKHLIDSGGDVVVAYKCPKCGKIELQVKENN